VRVPGALFIAMEGSGECSGGGLGQSSSEGRRHLGDVGGDVGDVGGDVGGLASTQGWAQVVLGLGLSKRAAFPGRKRDMDRGIDLFSL
jgi:hypothetical protein